MKKNEWRVRCVAQVQEMSNLYKILAAKAWRDDTAQGN
jgi:hypothetical protein